MRVDWSHVTDIFAVECSENVIAVLFWIRNEADWCEVRRELLDWDYSVWRVNTNYSLSWTGANYRGMRLGFHLVKDLTISKEDQHTLLDHVLENEVLVIVTNLINVRKQNIIDCSFPFLEQIIKIMEVVHLLLSNIWVEDLFVNSASQSRWNAPLSVLNKEWLVIFL